MKSDQKYMLLINKIEEIFREGITLSRDVLHYIDSTFSNPSIKELKEIICDETNCEKDSLVELIFSPDESIQTQLEDLLENQNYQKKDEKKLLNCLYLKKQQATIHFPNSKGLLKLTMSNSATDQFISHLNITSKLDKRLFDAIQMYVCEKSRNYVKVKMRNSRKRLTENKIGFMCAFFKNLKIKNNGNLKCLKYILDFFDELQDDEDIYSALMDKKNLYSQNLQKAVKYEEQLKKSNMETLILQGIRIPFVSKEDALKKIQIIDRISLAVFGKIEEPVIIFE
jgi:hypothetical protein